MSDGRLRRITYRWEGDGSPPSDGDVLVSVRGSAIYLVVEARPVRHRTPQVFPRLALDCLRVSADEVADDARVFDLFWDARSRRRAA